MEAYTYNHSYSDDCGRRSHEPRSLRAEASLATQEGLLQNKQPSNKTAHMHTHTRMHTHACTHTHLPQIPLCFQDADCLTKHKLLSDLLSSEALPPSMKFHKPKFHWKSKFLETPIWGRASWLPHPGAFPRLPLWQCLASWKVQLHFLCHEKLLLKALLEHYPCSQVVTVESKHASLPAEMPGCQPRPHCVLFMALSWEPSTGQMLATAGFSLPSPSLCGNSWWWPLRTFVNPQL